MPNLVFLAIGFLYKLGLAVWLGGGLALGALAAPALFRALPSRAEAGALFGSMLRAYSRLRLAVLPLVIAAAAAKYFLWETHASSTVYGVWIAGRWVGLALMSATLIYEVTALHPRIERQRADASADASPASREAFQRLHGRAESLMKLGLLGAALALLID